MKIREAVEFILSQNDDSIFSDQKKFIAYLKDLSADHPKELKVIVRSINTKILDLFFKSKETVNHRMSRVKWELEDQGLSDTWINTILEEFGTPLGWKIPSQTTTPSTTTPPPKTTKTQPAQHKKINKSTVYIEVELNGKILKQLGYADKAKITSIDIPETYTYNGVDYKITKIRTKLFQNCVSLTSVSIPFTVEKIGNEIFANCINLVDVTLPNNLEEIGYRAFSNCTSLENINIPHSVKYINDYAFENCTSLKNLTIPKSANIGYGAFENCPSMIIEVALNSRTLSHLGYNRLCSSINIPEKYNYNGNTYKITSIESSTFENWRDLRTINLPDGITEIGRDAFKACISLSSIKIPDSVTKIGDSAFTLCTVLRSVKLPDGLTKIETSTFSSCKILKNINIPDTVIKIGDFAFDGCSVLKNITLPSGIKDIGKYAFCWTDISDIDVPSGVQTVGIEAFKGVSNINYRGNLADAPWGAYNLNRPKDVKLDKNVLAQLGYNDKTSLTSIDIPATYTYNGVDYKITSISANAFQNCRFLEKVTIPDSVTKIEKWAFNNCKSLKSVLIPNSVEEIEHNVFEDCKLLVNIDVPKSVTKIGNDAFKDIANVNYNGSATGSPWGAISINGNIQYREAQLNSKTLKQLGYTDVKKIKSIDIPATFKYDDIYYKITSIWANTFEDCKDLESVTIPDTVTKIGEFAFKSCTSLKNLNIPNSVIAIGDYAFKNVQNVNYNGTATGSPWEAVSINGNIQYREVELNSKTLKQLGYTDVKKVKSIDIPATYQYDGYYYKITSISANTFEDCNNLKSVTIPETVVEIGEYAFKGCTSLKNVDISDYVLYIGENAFKGAQNINYNGSVSGLPWGSEKINGEIYYFEVELNDDILEKLGYKDKNAITSIDIPATFKHDGTNYRITKIGKECFLSCSSLKSVIIPDTVTEIGYSSFYNCKSLNNVKIPKSVISIGDLAFSYCYELNNLNIPKKVQSIGINAFKDIPNIRYKGSATGSPWGALDVNKLTEIALNDDALEILGYKDKKAITEIYIPATFTHKGKDYKIVSIKKELFKDCIALKKVTIANGILYILENAFENCKNLTDVIIPNGLKQIGNEAFKNCKSLEYVKVPYNAIVGYNAFKGVKNIIYLGTNIGETWGIKKINGASISKRKRNLAKANKSNLFNPINTNLMEKDDEDIDENDIWEKLGRIIGIIFVFIIMIWVARAFGMPTELLGCLVIFFILTLFSMLRH